ncbi:MAG: ribbon-helix-helix domain-containing protein [Candidatus Bathyarchaeia archaeon]
MPTVYVGARIERNLARKLDALVAGGKGKNRSEVIREAIREYVSTYTGEPTLKGLERRMREIDMRLKRVEDVLIDTGGLEILSMIKERKGKNIP